MTIRFNESGDLSLSSLIPSAFPCSMAIMIASDQSGSTSYQSVIGLSGPAEVLYGQVQNSGSGKRALAFQSSTGGSSAEKTSSPNLSSTVLQWLVVVFTSASSRTVYFGSNSGTTDTFSIPMTFGNLTTSRIGGEGGSNRVKGDLAEAHWYSTALTSGDVDTLLAGVDLPETITGWIDGWSLETYSAGGSYTSLGGSRTMTTSGTLGSSSIGHPYTRSGGGGGGVAPKAFRIIHG